MAKKQPTKEEIDAALHEGADLIDEITGPDAEPDEAAVTPGPADVAPAIVKWVHAMGMFRDADPGRIAQALATIPDFKGRTPEQVLEALKGSPPVRKAFVASLARLEDEAVAAAAADNEEM